MKKARITLPVKIQAYQPGCEYDFASNLRTLRMSRSPRLSQARLARELGVTRNTYAGYESGKRIAPAWFVRCAAEYFGVTSDELVGRSNERKD